ncbi:uncharacterized protein AKAW2_50311S [Aspergillus luchuensis]|uniref:Uncharacterized protein n=1 Tax=Aspergillus kawachii TaxID=1069201 RepID=A0A7R7WC36_ASPKA|nr:uncharacterized protein AKAW2_50311S [Aspergillus luchuensis]BCR99969.1 hypothetical protein AKAW2_50311S [Aspergillus luchuensis]
MPSITALHPRSVIKSRIEDGADNESNAVKYYLNEIVDFDTAAAFHKRPSNEVVQRELRSAILLADKTVTIGLTATQAKKITTDPEVCRLRRVCRALTAEIRSQGYKRVKDAADTEIGERKKRADARLNSTLTRLREEERRGIAEGTSGRQTRLFSTNSTSSVGPLLRLNYSLMWPGPTKSSSARSSLICSAIQLLAKQTKKLIFDD